MPSSQVQSIGKPSRNPPFLKGCGVYVGAQNFVPLRLINIGRCSVTDVTQALNKGATIENERGSHGL